MKKKELITNIVLIVLILSLGTLVATSRYVQPRSPIKTISSEREEETETEDISIESETPYTAPVERNIFPILGKRDIFRAIIQRPTPTPAPTRTPPPPPDLGILIRHWKLEGININQAIITDQAKKETFFMKEGETLNVNYRGKDYPVKLNKIDTMKFQVEFIMEGDTEIKSLF